MKVRWGGGGGGRVFGFRVHIRWRMCEGEVGGQGGRSRWAVKVGGQGGWSRWAVKVGGQGPGPARLRPCLCHRPCPAKPLNPALLSPSTLPC